MKKLMVFAFMLLMLITASNAAKIPVISSHVTDNAGILSQDAKSQLETSLRELEKETNGVQYVVYIEKEYPKEFSLEEYSLKIAEQNKIGKKGNDNGILLYIAVSDKKYRWEVGYGVESALNSALLGRISREHLVPNFQQGNYERGVLEAVDITKRLLLNSNDADIVALKNPKKLQGAASIFFLIVSSIFQIIPAIVFLIVVIAIFRMISRKNTEKIKGKRRNDRFYQGAAWGLFAGGFGRGGSGGFSSGGGFGGFSGGGGGFGGGGHSGGW